MIAAGHGRRHEEVILSLGAKLVFPGAGVVDGSVPLAVGQRIEIADRQHRIGSLCARNIDAEQLRDLRCGNVGTQRGAVFIRHLDGQRLRGTEHTQQRECLLHIAVAVRREGNVLGIDLALRRDAGNELSGADAGRGIAGSLKVDALAGVAWLVNDPLAAVPVAVERQYRQAQILAAVAVHHSEAFDIVVVFRRADAHRRVHSRLAARRNGHAGGAVGDLRTGDLLDGIVAVLRRAIGVERIGSQRVGLRLSAIVRQGHREAGRGTDLLEGSAAEAVHSRQNAGLGRADRIDHAGALLTDGIRRRAVGLINDIRRVHQRKLQIVIDLDAIQRQLACLLRGLDRLECQRGSAGDIGRRHAGAAHDLIAAAGRDRIDVSAGRGDLGLDVQRRGGAPAGEGAHFPAVCGSKELGLQFVECHALAFGCKRQQLLAEVVADHDLTNLAPGGSCVAAANIERYLAAWLVVVNHNTGCAEHKAEIDLILERNIAALYHRDPLGVVARKLNAAKQLVERAVAAVDQQNVLERFPAVAARILLAHCVVKLREIENCRLMQSAGSIRHGDGVALEIGVVDRSNRQNAGCSTRSGDRAGIHNTEIVCVDAEQRSARAVIACRYAAEHAVVGRALERCLEVSHVVIEARSAAEGQIHDVRPQLDGVLDCTDDVIREGAAAHAEHLKAKDLRIGRNARDAVLTAVAGSDAGYVQAVRVGMVVHLIVAGIAVGERNLIGIIGAVAELLDQSLGVALRDADLRAVGKFHIGMAVVDAAVEHSDHRALAGVAHLLPHLIHRRHVGSIIHLHFKGRDRRDRLDAGKLRDLRHLGGRHVHRERVDKIRRLLDGVVAGDRLRAADHGLLCAQSLRLHRLELRVQLRAHALDGGALHGRLRLHFHDHTDLLIRVEFIRRRADQPGLRTSFRQSLLRRSRVDGAFLLLLHGSGGISLRHIDGLHRDPGQQAHDQQQNRQASENLHFLHRPFPPSALIGCLCFHPSSKADFSGLKARSRNTLPLNLE